MENKERQDILSQLAQTESDAARKALEKEAQKIAEILKSETEYNTLEDQLELLEVFARRTPDEAFAIIDSFLLRLKTMEPTHIAVDGFSNEEIKKYHNQNSLVVKTIGVLGIILLFDPELDRKILDLLLEYSISGDESVRKASLDKIHTLASYHMGVWNIKTPNGNLVGPEPQQNLVNFLNSFPIEKRKKYFAAIIVLCESVLGPTIDATQWSYNKVSISTASIPAVEVMKTLRSQVLTILKGQYAIADTFGRKRAVINALQTATRTPPNAPYKGDLLNLIAENTIEVLNILLGLLVAETDLLIVQHIEHIAYWKHKLAYNDAIRGVALKIKDALDSNSEYQIFKTLIGWEGIFNEWRVPTKSDAEETKREVSEVEQAQKVRDQKIQEYAKVVTAENFTEWKSRILEWSQLQSNDMAMFPAFAKFLDLMSKNVPNLALSLLETNAAQLGNFIPFLLGPALNSTCKEQTHHLIETWLGSGSHLWQISRIFEFDTHWNIPLFKALITKALERSDKPALRNTVSVLVANYTHERRPLANEFIAPIMQKLTELNDPHWVSGIWFRREINEFIQDLEEPGIDAILTNLVLMKAVDYETEAVLTAIARKIPEKIFDFIGARLAKEAQRQRLTDYDAVPYQFHSLQEVLSQFPAIAVKAVSKWFDGNYGMFVHRGAQFLHNIFPNMPDIFAAKLIDMVRSGERENLLIVLATLRNYRGESTTYEICKEIVKLLPKDSPELSEVAAVLESTGIVTGEYGLAEAYELKKNQVSSWLEDAHENVKAFAEKYISMLDRKIEWARSQADEELALRKYRYGSDEEEV